LKSVDEKKRVEIISVRKAVAAERWLYQLARETQD